MCMPSALARAAASTAVCTLFGLPSERSSMILVASARPSLAKSWRARTDLEAAFPVGVAVHIVEALAAYERYDLTVSVS